MVENSVLESKVTLEANKGKESSEEDDDEDLDKNENVRRIPSRRFSFRLKINDAIQLEEEIKETYGIKGKTKFFKKLLKQRRTLAKLHQDFVREQAERCLRYSITLKELGAAGVPFDDSSVQKRGD